MQAPPAPHTTDAPGRRHRCLARSHPAQWPGANACAAGAGVRPLPALRAVDGGAALFATPTPRDCAARSTARGAAYWRARVLDKPSGRSRPRGALLRGRGAVACRASVLSQGVCVCLARNAQGLLRAPHAGQPAAPLLPLAPPRRARRAAGATHRPAGVGARALLCSPPLAESSPASRRAQPMARASVMSGVDAPASSRQTKEVWRARAGARGRVVCALAGHPRRRWALQRARLSRVVDGTSRRSCGAC